MSASIYTSLPWNNYYGFFSLIWYLLLVFGLYRTFEKAGEKGWKAIIPFYNLYICFQIGNRSTYFLFWLGATVLAVFFTWLSAFTLLFWTALFAWILSLLAACLLASMWYGVSVQFGHGLGFALGLIFLNPIFIMILGFGSSRYQGARYW